MCKRLNRNKCCIEIYLYFVSPILDNYWTETSVVLKFITVSCDFCVTLIEPKQVLYWNFPKNMKVVKFFELNRNKCCIEMIIYLLVQLKTPLLNRNKCCIEMVNLPPYISKALNWTETSVVLKFFTMTLEPPMNAIEPKQVLYWNLAADTNYLIKNLLNRNKCCIEIQIQHFWNI